MSGYGSGPYGFGAFGRSAEIGRIVWDQTGEKFFETGCDRAVVYPKSGGLHPWNGVVSVNEEPGGGSEPLFLDGVKYGELQSAESFSATVAAFYPPPEFIGIDGVRQILPGVYATGQRREPFDMTYRTLVGNDLKGTSFGYKLHLVYNCTLSPSTTTYETTTADASLSARSWQLNAVPDFTSQYRPTAHLVLNSTELDPYILEELETLLYGRDPFGGLTRRSGFVPTFEELAVILGNKITATIELTV